MNYDEFQKYIGVTFRDTDLLKQAFTHRSYINEHRDSGLHHNERLEFLGDAVLELAVTRFLFDEYPDKSEGELTSYRAALVNTQSLSEVADDIGMNNLLLLSKGEAKDTGRARYYLLANTVEAVIGAIYLDQGYEAAADFVNRFITPRIDEVLEKGTWLDAKSYFQERAQDELGVTPTYQTLEESGPDHAKVFTVGVYLDNDRIAQGSGSSKQEAEQDAARRGLEEKGWK